MAFNISQQVKVVNPVSSVDEMYGPYNSVQDALDTIDSALLTEATVGRHIGIIEDGQVVDYIYQNVENGRAFVKVSSGLTSEQFEQLAKEDGIKAIFSRLHNDGTVGVNQIKTGEYVYDRIGYDTINGVNYSVWYCPQYGKRYVQGSIVVGAMTYYLTANNELMNWLPIQEVSFDSVAMKSDIPTKGEIAEEVVEKLPTDYAKPSDIPTDYAKPSDIPTDYARQGANAKTLDDIQIDTTELAKEETAQAAKDAADAAKNAVEGLSIPTKTEIADEVEKKGYSKKADTDYQYQSLNNDTQFLIEQIGDKQGGGNLHQKSSALIELTEAIQSLLDARLGKLKVVSAASTMAVDATTFPTSSIVLCHDAVTISSVANLTYEVVFVVDANVEFGVPSGIPTMGEADNTKRREFSFLNGALVVGNFE